jgi:hypothetical protein
MMNNVPFDGGEVERLLVASLFAVGGTLNTSSELTFEV